VTTHPDDNVVVWHGFRCPVCGTVFECNRAEPGCLTGDHAHPDQWHLQRLRLSDAPCESCSTWIEPVAKYGIDADRDDTVVILFPALDAS